MTDHVEPTDTPDLVDLIRAKATVMILQPADVLIISNMSGTAPETIGVDLDRLRNHLGVSKIYAFADDIDITVLRAAAEDAINDLAARVRQAQMRAERR